MTTLSPRRAFRSALALAGAALLASCAGAPSGPSAPTSVPDVGSLPGVQTASYPATVLDDGDGPELCVGPMLTSYPPQCGGPALVGWDWADWQGHFTEASGVRWGSFWVAGHYDAEADSVTLAQAKPAEEYAWPDAGADSVDFTTPCLAPAGGWQVLDPARTTQQTLDQVLAAAAALEGYAGAWVDQSPNPLSEKEPTTGEEMLEQELAMNDPALLIVNVRTTGDIATAETALRAHWGGMLCVSAAAHSEADLLGIQQELTLAGVFMSWADATTGKVHVSVLFDDGTLQRELDERHGAGLVAVESALAPWS